MSARKFNAKFFNDEAFGKYEGTVPKPRINALVSSGALGSDASIEEAFAGNVGLDQATVFMFGRTKGFDQKYNGVDDIEASGMGSYKRSVKVFRQAGAWTEYDFTYDVTNGVDFLDQMAQQISGHKEDLVQDLMMSELDGIFGMSAGAENLAFVDKHTFDITDSANPSVGAVTMNTALQRACGDQRSKFALGCFHSKIVADLENINAVEYMKYTDMQGITRDMSMGTWNGKKIMETDIMPVYAAGTYKKVAQGVEGALEIVASGASDGQVNKADVTAAGTMFGYVAKAGDYVKSYDKDAYVSYVLGQGAFGYKDIGAKVPYEAERSALTKGGQDTLISRVGYLMTPNGFSWEPSAYIGDPQLADFADGANWTLAKNDDGTQFFPHKVVPIARIISLA